MKRVLLFISFITVIIKISSAQTVLQGVITDSITNETLIGVTVMLDAKGGTTADLNGHYQIGLTAGGHTIKFSYIGYADKTIVVDAAKDTLHRNIKLSPLSKQLNLIVVSGSKYEKRITDETVSMEVLQPNFIENTNARTVDEAMDKVPGVQIIDGQANIRGCSGYQYGAGSRVMVMVDGLPELSADASDVKWDFLPIEDIQQVEVIKGASSVLYGSSALDGVINIITVQPTDTPHTIIDFYEGIYGNPQDKNAIWWQDAQPYFNGGYFMHSQRFGQLDLVVSGNVANEQSYLQGAYNQRARFTANTHYRFKHIAGLSVGINTSFQMANSGTYFVWQNDSTGILKPLGGTTASTTTLTDGQLTRFTFDPYITYDGPNGSIQTLRTRYYLTNNVESTDQGSKAQLYYAEYQYQKELRFHFTVTAGLVANAKDVNAQLYGNHNGTNLAGYLQVDKKIGRLSLTGGLRYETNRVDSVEEHSPVVFRTGANYKLAKATFLRASFGEGYRFPSIAEEFTKTEVGPLTIFPNPNIQPETGYSGEVGVKQGVKIGNWLGYADLAVFWMQYTNLIDFTFGCYHPPGQVCLPQYLGFKAINIENARITGAELSYTAKGTLFGLPADIIGGITAINPINLAIRDSVNNYEAAHPNLTSSQKDSLSQTEILNYRSKYTAKLDFDITYRKFTFGAAVRYNSFMVNIDKIFEGTDPQLPIEIVPGIEEFRQSDDNGDYIIDAHLAYQATKSMKVSFIVKNLLNRMYTDRPGELEPPRNYTLQVEVKF